MEVEIIENNSLHMRVITLGPKEDVDVNILCKPDLIKNFLSVKQNLRSYSKCSWYGRRFICSVDTNQRYEFPYRFKCVRVSSDDSNNDIFDLATKIFLYDSRFQFCIKEKTLYESYIDWYIKQAKEGIVCYHDDKLAGFILLSIDSDFCKIILAGVHNNYRFTGLAIELYYQALRLAEKYGFKKIYGDIDSNNLSSLNIYRKLNADFFGVYDILGYGED